MDWHLPYVGAGRLDSAGGGSGQGARHPVAEPQTGAALVLQFLEVAPREAVSDLATGMPSTTKHSQFV